MWPTSAHQLVFERFWQHHGRASLPSSGAAKGPRCMDEWNGRGDWKNSPLRNRSRGRTTCHARKGTLQSLSNCSSFWLSTSCGQREDPEVILFWVSSTLLGARALTMVYLVTLSPFLEPLGLSS